MVHNFYREAGGEDLSFVAETDMLRLRGNHVYIYTRDNHEISTEKYTQRLRLALNTVWAVDSFSDIRKILRTKKIDLVHFQNTFPLISPAAYYACQQERVPVVQSLHNYRLRCLNGLFSRNKRICEDCLKKLLPWPGLVHACYHKSHLQSSIVAGMLFWHRMIKTWDRQVDIFISLSEFSRDKFVQGGIPRGKIKVKPNFVADPGVNTAEKDYATYIGRLSEEKGILTMLKAWEKLKAIPLKIIGTGPSYEMIEFTIRLTGLHLVELLGHLSHSSTLSSLKNSRFLIFPTEVYETFGRVVIEAFSTGIPVIASRIGAVTELIRDGETGLLFNPGDPTDLANKVNWLWNHPEVSRCMGKNARREYELKYTPERNYQILMDIYQKAIGDQV